jgi:hypothetical protein
MAVTIEQARAAKDAAKAELAGVPGVVGIGLMKVGDDYALKVNLRAEPPPGVIVPERVAGVPVCVEIVGEIRKRPSDPSR